MENILKEKSFAFALRVVNLSRYLMDRKTEYVLSKQILRSGTAIGALVCEAEFAQSKPDFVNKLSVALKEANETHYWLKLLHKSDFLTENMFESMQPEIKDLVSLLVASVKTAKRKNKMS